MSKAQHRRDLGLDSEPSQNGHNPESDDFVYSHHTDGGFGENKKPSRSRPSKRYSPRPSLPPMRRENRAAALERDRDTILRVLVGRGPRGPPGGPHG